MTPGGVFPRLVARSYGDGRPAPPSAAAHARRVLGHEGADRENASRRVAVAFVEADAVVEPRIVGGQPSFRRVAGEQDEVLVATEADLGDDRTARIQLGVNHIQVGAEPAGDGDPTARVAIDRAPEELNIVEVPAVAV